MGGLSILETGSDPKRTYSPMRRWVYYMGRPAREAVVRLM